MGPLHGIGFAVGLSLLHVIYESVRPQITILWRVPGTRDGYRSIRQEGGGLFVEGVFIARLGASLYFANAAFVKDALRGFLLDFRESRTDYVVLDMTPVVTLDSTAVRVVEDIVQNLWERDIRVAFAAVGDRALVTLGRAHLISKVGGEWFHPSVDEAVRFCVIHRDNHRGRKDEVGLALPRASASYEAEVGFSNTQHHDCTVFFVRLAGECHDAMGKFQQLFSNHGVNIKSVQIDGLFHTYFVQLVKGRKLSVGDANKLLRDLAAVANTNMKSGAA